ncbi:acyl-CoA N-acyltransferase [Xylaria sp. CBS 124048]|nr:acyl-CoA N-acyltransferase [Xylaria sp. CBS 124048]
MGLIEETNEKSDDQFIKEHLRPGDPSWSSWTHPNLHTKYTIELIGSETLTPTDFEACFDLIEETSRPDYESSSIGWKPARKLSEMKSPGLRYILVKDSTGMIHGFTSLMPTHEVGEPVLYCYEIHLKPMMRRYVFTGLGTLLLSFLDRVAAHTPPIEKIMLTCFLRNQKAFSFYKALGYTEDPSSPAPKMLRNGRVVEPDYVILSKVVARRANE